MRIALIVTLLAGVVLVAAHPVQAAPLALADHAATSQQLAVSGVEPVARKAVKTKRAVRKSRRYDWTYYPYWRPYQFSYWQHYYPYGGPLF
ncbi:MAG: hypothetical protein ACREDO_10935 [Methyloceanibacter sp.]